MNMIQELSRELYFKVPGLSAIAADNVAAYMFKIGYRPLSTVPAAKSGGVGGGSELTQTAIKDHFEANMLDGDDVNDCGGCVISAVSVLEYIQEFYRFNYPKCQKCKGELQYFCGSCRKDFHAKERGRKSGQW